MLTAWHAALLVRYSEGLVFPNTRNSSYPQKRGLGQGELRAGVRGEAAHQCPGEARTERDSPSVSVNKTG